MRPICNYCILRMDLPSIAAAESDHAITALKQETGLEIWKELNAKLLCSFEQQMIENLPAADEGHVVGARDQNVMQGRGDEPQAIDRIGFTRNALTHTEELEYLAAFR